MLNADDEAKLAEQIEALTIEHRDLDEVITNMSQGVYVDQLQLKRLKKRKLTIKDSIERFRSLLIPDLNA
jgi:hypothetical protein